MEADDVVIEYLRKKLSKARGARAEKVMKPQVEAEMPAEEMPPEDMAQLQQLVAENGGEMETEDEEE